jgi:hypothetical protein
MPTDGKEVGAYWSSTLREHLYGTKDEINEFNKNLGLVRKILRLA